MDNLEKDIRQITKEKFSKRFKLALKNNHLENYTYKKLGRFFNTTDMTVHNWLNAKSIPAMTRLPNIAKKLSVSIEYLVDDNFSNDKKYFDTELKLVNDYRKLSKQQQEVVSFIIAEFKT